LSPKKLLKIEDCEKLSNHEVRELYKKYINPAIERLFGAFDLGQEIVDHAEGVWIYTKNNEKILGVGEIGLDHTYTNSDEEFIKQEQVFRTQLSYAEKFRKPVSIHSRKTLDEIFKILPSYNIPTTLLHWFDGSKKQLQKAMDLDCYVSFGPVMVYSKDKQVLLSKTRKDKILVETDGPVRFSRCFENRTAQIDFIPSIVFCASKVLHMNYDALCDVIEQNSKRFLIL
jgi:TatD DNase family protein